MTVRTFAPSGSVVTVTGIDKQGSVGSQDAYDEEEEDAASGAEGSELITGAQYWDLLEKDNAYWELRAKEYMGMYGEEVDDAARIRIGISRVTLENEAQKTMFKVLGDTILPVDTATGIRALVAKKESKALTLWKANNEASSRFLKLRSLYLKQSQTIQTLENALSAAQSASDQTRDI